MKYYIEDPLDEKYTVEVPKSVVNAIISDYLAKTYYWSVGLLCMIIGFLLGVIA